MPGHEGLGILEKVCSNVETLEVGDHIPEIEETEANVHKHRANFLLRDSFTFYILDKLSGKFIGSCSHFRADWQLRRFEIG